MVDKTRRPGLVISPARIMLLLIDCSIETMNLRVLRHAAQPVLDHGLKPVDRVPGRPHTPNKRDLDIAIVIDPHRRQALRARAGIDTGNPGRGGRSKCSAEQRDPGFVNADIYDVSRPQKIGGPRRQGSVSPEAGGAGAPGNVAASATSTRVNGYWPFFPPDACRISTPVGPLDGRVEQPARTMREKACKRRRETSGSATDARNRHQLRTLETVS